MRHALTAALTVIMFTLPPLTSRGEEASGPVILGGAAASAVRVAVADFAKTHRSGIDCFNVFVSEEDDGTIVEFAPRNFAEYPKTLPNGDILLFSYWACERVDLTGVRYKIGFSGKIAERRIKSQ